MRKFLHITSPLDKFPVSLGINTLLFRNPTFFIALPSYNMIGVRLFSVSAGHSTANSSDGNEIDSTTDIAAACDNTIESVDQWFTTKRYNIQKSFDREYASGVKSKVNRAELSNWEKDKNKMLDELEYQYYDVLDMKNIPMSSTVAADSHISPPSQPAVATAFHSSSASQPPATTQSISATQVPGVTASSTAVRPSFRQDSSDVTRTEFDSFDPFDE